MSKKVDGLIRKLRKGELASAIEIRIDGRGKVNKVLIKSKSPQAFAAGKEKKLTVSAKPSFFKGADLSDTLIENSDLSGLNLKGSDFSGSKIKYTNFKGADLTGSNFYNTVISQSDLSHSYGAKMHDSYMTGSVNLYNSSPAGESSGWNPWSDTVKRFFWDAPKNFFDPRSRNY